MNKRSKADEARRIIEQFSDAEQYLREMIERAEALQIRFRDKLDLESVQDMIQHDAERIAQQRQKVERIAAAINSIEDEKTHKIVALRSKGKSWIATSLAVYLSINASRARFNKACEDLIIPMAEKGLIKL